MPVLLENIDPRLDPDALEAIVQEFFMRQVPVTLAIGPDMPKAQVERLGAVQMRQPWLLECVAVLQFESVLPRYFVLRAASDMRADLAARGWPRDASMMSCIVGRPISEVNIYALRAAGFRVRLSGAGAGKSAPTTIRQPDWGQLNISGGIVAALQDGPATLPDFVEGEDILLRLSVSSNVVVQDAALWADWISKLIQAGSVVVTRPSDLLGFLGGGVSSFLGLVVDPQGERGDGGPVAAFLADLQENGLPYNLLPDNEPSQEDEVAVCGPNGPLTSASVLHHCIMSSPNDTSHLAPDIRIVLVPPEGGLGWTGQRPDGRFQVSLQDWSAGSLNQRLADYPFMDRVMLVRASELQTPVQRRTVLSQILAAAQDGRVHVRSVNGYLDEILAPDAHLVRFWSVRERFEGVAFHGGLVGSVEAHERHKDAETAWSFIDRYTEARTGFCAGTVNWGATPTIDRTITLWDVGSQMQGTVSAAKLGIIGRDEAKGRIDRLLESLPLVEIDGERLPPAAFDGRTLAPAANEFDSCDVGRFLVALRRCVDEQILTLQDGAAIIARWSLGAAIRKGRIHDFRKGRWIEATESHCNSYALRGFQAWGMEFARAYPTMSKTPSVDDRLRLYYLASDIGHYGTEPALLDLIETGGEAATVELARLLFDAQVSFYEETGQFKCASESPLSFDPWFVYQGLRLDRLGAEAWIIAPKVQRTEFQSAAFKRRADILSCKSAYLWLAQFPSLYSEALVSIMRQKARVEGRGFLVGIFAQSNAPMDNYSDINTNGIILSSLDNAAIAGQLG